MPGFNICGTGDGPDARAESRRKHRFVWQTLSMGTGGSTDQFTAAELLYLLKAQRPHQKFNEMTMHHDQEQAYFAGKTEWDPIKLVWYDMEQPDISERIWTWINRVSDISQGCANIPSYYKGEAILHMVSGCATGSGAGSGQETVGGAKSTQKWRLCNVWPSDSNWGDLDYSDNDVATIEVVMRFDRAMLVY